MFESRLGLIAAAGLALCAAGSANGQPQERQMGGIGITVFDDIGYRGPNATFRSDQPDLGVARFANRISSLQVAPGEVWEVCEGVNYGPPCQVFSGNESDLRRRSWNDRISSLRRVRGGRGGGGFPSPGGGRLVLYADERFRGQAVPITGPTPSLGSFNDKAESLRIDSGTWEVCEDINYGKCRTVSRDMPNLSGLGLSKRVSSVRPSFNGGGGGGGGGYPVPLPQPVRLVLYDRERYRGGARTLDSGQGNLGGFGNRAQSVQVVGTWQLCDGPNFTGRCVTVQQNVPNLAAYGMNNRVSSARPLGR
jgi:hypothetical protein